MAGSQKKIGRLSHEQRHQQILDAALKVFSQKGYSGARTKDIASLAGISETLLFQHFGSKENLYAESMEALFAHHPVLPELAGFMERGDDYNVLYTLALHMISHARKDPRMIRMIFFAALESMTPEHRGSQQGHHGQEYRQEGSPDPVVKGLVAYFQRRSAQGAFVDVDIELAVRMFFYSAWMYAADRELNFLGDFKGIEDEQAVHTLVELFLSGLHKK